MMQIAEVVPAKPAAATTGVAGLETGDPAKSCYHNDDHKNTSFVGAEFKTWIFL